MKNKKLKIALFHNAGKGGAKRALYEFVRQLSLRGHSIDLFTFATSGEEEFLPLSGFIQKKFVFEIDNSVYIKLRPYILEIIYNFVRKLLFFSKLNHLSKKVAEQINNGDYDLAYIDLCLFTTSPFVLRYINIPNVYFCHNPSKNKYEIADGSDYKNANHNTSLTRKIYSSLCDFILNLDFLLLLKIDRINTLKAKNIFTNSYFTKEYIFRNFGLHAKVVYLGVDTERFKPINIKKEGFVLSVGRLCQQKKFDFIINALSLIPKESRPELVIAGFNNSQPVKLSLIKLADQKNVKLMLKEGINDEALLNLYNQASIMVFTPLMEPFGFVSLEAMACGTPVIGVREGGLRESIKDKETGILVDRDERELRDAIEALLENDGLRDTLSKKAKNDILVNWTWDKAGNRLEDNLFRAIGQLRN